MKEKRTAILKNINEKYHRLGAYFTNGSFGINFYPFLMYPCVRHSYHFMLRTIGVCSAFIGLYYLFAEFIAVLFSHSPLTYFQHSTLELLQPIGSIIDEKTSQLSPLFYMMKISFILQSAFIFIYLFGISKISGTRYRLLGTILAICFSIGVILTAYSQGGKYIENGLFNLGTIITFICSNFVLFITGWSILNPFKKLKYYSIIAGFIGISALLSTIFIPTPYFPIIERLGIYSVVIWEIAVSFAILKQVEK